MYTRAMKASAESTGQLSRRKELEYLDQGKCTEADTDGLFVGGAPQQEARKVCVGCSVIQECGDYALRYNEEFGVWGGMTERERRALIKLRRNAARRDELAAETEYPDYEEQAS